MWDLHQGLPLRKKDLKQLTLSVRCVDREGTALSFLRPSAAPSPLSFVYVYSGQERFAAVGVLKGPIILSMVSLKTYQPQSYCCGLFFTQRTRHCLATLQPAYRPPRIASHQPAQHRIQIRRPSLLLSIPPVFMELNCAQAIVDPEGDLWWLRIRFELGYGFHITSSRCVHFLAEQCVAEFLEQFVCFHLLS